MLAFGAFTTAGSLLDAQIGLGIAQILDPASHRPASLLSTTMTYAGVVVFFLINGHHVLLRAIGYSVEVFPVGRLWQPAHAAEAIFVQAGALFSLGFALAAPVAFCLLLTELALSMVARNLPQMNMLALGFPVKILVGLAAFSWWFSAGIGSVLAKVYESIYSTWSAFFALALRGTQ